MSRRSHKGRGRRPPALQTRVEAEAGVEVEAEAGVEVEVEAAAAADQGSIPTATPPSIVIAAPAIPQYPPIDINRLIIDRAESSASQHLPISGFEVSLTQSAQDGIDAYVGPERARSNLMALYTHQVPAFVNEWPRLARREASRNAPRTSGRPPPPSGSSTSSTDKAAYLVAIMQNDELLRSHGIRIEYDRSLITKLDSDLRDQLDYHEDAEFLRKWNNALQQEYDFLSDESSILTNEPTTSGVFRSHLYHHCNRFVAFARNFALNTPSPPLPRFGRWGDPPTTVGSVADVASWKHGMTQCVGEHKREQVCTSRHMEAMIVAASRENLRLVGITINVADDRLVWGGLDTTDASLRHKVKLFIIQLVTQFYCNKALYNYLYNFEDLIVMKILNKTTFAVSQRVTRSIGHQNVPNCGPRPPSAGSPPALHPTVLSTLVALLVAPYHATSSCFPSTKGLGEISISQSNAEHYTPLPPNVAASTVDDFLDSPASPSSDGRNEPPMHGSALGYAAQCVDDALAFHKPHLMAKRLCLPNDDTPPSSSLSLSLHIGPESSPPRFATHSDSNVIVGELHTLRDQGRLWTVYDGFIDIPPDLKSVVATKSTSSFSTTEGFSPSAKTSRTDSGVPLGGLLEPENSNVHTIESSSDSSDTVSDSDSCRTSPDTSIITTTTTSPLCSSQTVVFKVVDPSSFRNSPKERLDPGEYNPQMAILAILNEATLYCTRLRPLQGKYIPRFYGLFKVEGLWIMVLEDFGEHHALPRRPSAEDLQDIPSPYHRAVLNMYTALHHCGVIHNDVAVRHIRTSWSHTCPGYVDLRLIDFEASREANEALQKRELQHVATSLRGAHLEWHANGL